MGSYAVVNAALRLADLGYRVFPCVPGGKQPATAHGCLDATTDEEQIQEWWEQNENYNIGVATDGLVVIDVDPSPDGKRNEWADEIEHLADLLIGAGTITPRGGSHFWFRQPDGVALRNTASKIADGVDTRASGGYVLAPPSVIAGVGGYHWQPGYVLDFAPDDLPTPPAWLLDALLGRDDAEHKEPLRIDGEIHEGTRNDMLARLAGGIRRMGASEATIRSAIRSANIEQCKPPLSDKEVDKIAWSIARCEPDQITQAAVEGWYDQQHAEPADAWKPEEQPEKLPRRLLEVGGLMQEVIAWNIATAYKPQPELALAGVLSLMGAVTGRRITDEMGTRTNVYCMGVCESGGGKEHARKINKAILSQSGLNERLGPEGIGSHAGLTACIGASPEVLIQIDEMGRFLRVLGNPDRSPHLYQIVTVLLKLFTSSNSQYVGDTYADQKKVVRLDQPHCCLYGTSVPKSVLESLTTESLSDGFLSRFLIFEASDNDPPDNEVAEFSAVPTDIAERFHWWAGYQPGGNLSSVVPQPRRLTPDDAAVDVFKSFRRSVSDRRKAETGDAVLWTRAYEKARKLALLHQVSRTREAMKIDRHAAQWACDVVESLTVRLEWLAEQWISDGVFDAKCKKVLRLIRQAGSRGVTASQICLASRNLTPRDRQEVLNSLFEAGQVVKTTQKTNGRPAMVYKAISEKMTP